MRFIAPERFENWPALTQKLFKLCVLHGDKQALAVLIRQRQNITNDLHLGTFAGIALMELLPPPQRKPEAAQRALADIVKLSLVDGIDPDVRAEIAAYLAEQEQRQ